MIFYLNLGGYLANKQSIVERKKTKPERKKE
jgi:hypothetical protein